MSVLAALRHRLRTLLRPAAYARELREEIEFHLSLEAMEQSRGPEGSMDDAPYAARRRFGNVTRYSEETREMSGLGFFDVLRHDARFAFRTFRQAKGFTAVAVATIALGIGATAAVFSVVDALILKPLPYPEADRVVMVWMDNRRLALKEDVHSYPNLMDLKAQNRSLSHLNAYCGNQISAAIGAYLAERSNSMGRRGRSLECCPPRSASRASGPNCGSRW